jgi:small redox-active disulfide protein 2
MKCTLYGRQCNKCQQLEDHLNEAAQDLDIDYEFERITETIDILTAGIMHTPALLINDEIVVEGKVASFSELKKLLQASRYAHASIS